MRYFVSSLVKPRLSKLRIVQSTSSHFQTPMRFFHPMKGLWISPAVITARFVLYCCERLAAPTTVSGRSIRSTKINNKFSHHLPILSCCLLTLRLWYALGERSRWWIMCASNKTFFLLKISQAKDNFDYAMIKLLTQSIRQLRKHLIDDFPHSMIS